MATHSSILAWRISWTESGGLQSMGSQRVRHDWSNLAHTQATEHSFLFFLLTHVASWPIIASFGQHSVYITETCSNVVVFMSAIIRVQTSAVCPSGMALVFGIHLSCLLHPHTNIPRSSSNCWLDSRKHPPSVRQMKRPSDFQEGSLTAHKESLSPLGHQLSEDRGGASQERRSLLYWLWR